MEILVDVHKKSLEELYHCLESQNGGLTSSQAEKLIDSIRN
jgi:hypothetical protein